MIKFLEILEELFRAPSSAFVSGLPRLDEALGSLSPGIYGITGPGRYPQHLALQFLQQNDDVCLYYGYVYPPLTAMQRLAAYGLRMAPTQLLVDPRAAMTRNTSFSAFRLRMRFMNFIDMFERLPVPPVSIERMLHDIHAVREKEDQLVVICLDDFAGWLRTSTNTLDAATADPVRIALSLRDFCQVYQVIILAPCAADDPTAALLADISSGIITLEAGPGDGQDNRRPFTVTARTTIGEYPLPYHYRTDLECFVEPS